MLRTLIFGAIAGIVGKKLYESGAINEFVEDAKTRYRDATAERTQANPAPATAGSGPIVEPGP
jgi:hypothetical protein